jgi:hypothetical protein
MKRFAIPAIPLAVLMASGVAFAQTTPDQQPSTQPQEMQQQKQPEQQQPEAQQPAPSPDSGLTVNVDASKAVLATSFIGSSVFTTTNENIGDINDLIFDDKGAVQAAIVGIGGFLGMGEKDVALPLNKITVTRDENNAIKLTVQATREELERAPAFDKTLFQVKAPAGGGTTTPTTPTPQ